MDTQQQKAKLLPKYIFPLILFVLSISFINTAWVAEDAFITFRAVDNLLAGHGPVWNIGERVQVYTHPLWYLLLSIGTALTGSSFYVSLLLSWLCLAGIAWIISRLIRTQMQNQWGWLAVAMLAVSRAFTDYSSSGRLQHQNAQCETLFGRRRQSQNYPAFPRPRNGAPRVRRTIVGAR